MTTITVKEPITGLQESFSDGYELALAMRHLYKEDILEHEVLDKYFDIKELKTSEINKNIELSVSSAKKIDKNLLYDL